MANNKPQNQEKNPLDNLTEYYEDNKKRINTISTVVLVVVVGIFAYLKLYRAPRMEKAATSIGYAQRMLEMDSLDLALNGDAGNPGFLKIQRKYSGTPTGNLCNYYIGVCYLQKGEFNNAIKYLEDFNGKGTLVGNIAQGALGDAYMEAGNTQKGIAAYEKAISNGNDVTAPLYLERLAVVHEMNNNTDKAKEAYLKIRDNYPTSSQAQDIDRRLARMGVVE